MNETELTMENRIGIRLVGIEFKSDDRRSAVTFELYSEGHSVGDGVRPLAQISHDVPRQGGVLPDYDAIVREVAWKLRDDFNRVVKMLDSFAEERS